MRQSLEIKISNAGLEQIASQNGVVVIADSILPVGGKPIAWFTLPAASDTKILWNDALDAYWSAETSLPAGETIAVAGTQGVSMGNTYTLESNGTFSSSRGAPPGGIVLRNQSGADKVLGLSGTAQIGDQVVTGPCSAVVTWSNYETEVFPVNQVYVFVASAVEDGMVLSDFPPTTLAVETTGSTTVVYNPSTQTFEKLR